MKVGEYYTWRDQMSFKVLSVGSEEFEMEIVHCVDFLSYIVGQRSTYRLDHPTILNYFKLVSPAKAIIYY